VATLTIRNIDDALKASLRIRAARNGRSMEEEVRQLLRHAVAGVPAQGGLGSSIARRFGAAIGVDLPLPRRSHARRPPALRSRRS